jgi:hypothetical protein
MILGGLPLFALSGIWESEQWVHLNLYDWSALAYSTIFGSAIAYGLFFYFASSGNLTSLSSLTFLTPVFALLFGNLLLSEVLSPLQWTGVGMTLVSIYLINQREQIAERFRSFFGQPAIDATNMESDRTSVSTNDEQPLDNAQPVTLAPMPLKIEESEAPMLPGR